MWHLPSIKLITYTYKSKNYGIVRAESRTKVTRRLKLLFTVIIIIAAAIILLIAINYEKKPETIDINGTSSSVNDATPSSDTIQIYDSSEELKAIPEWQGLPICYLNDNEPSFKNDEIWERAQESLSWLDDLGRCGTAMSCIGLETMPEEARGQISSIKPSGWQDDKYDYVVGNNLYNRCHLVGYQLSGDDAIDRNLITGTSFMNREGMLPFENAIAKYVRETGNHVMYRVKPLFNKNEMVARGVQMEAVSVEDKGQGLAFNVFCYNVQPGIEIDYMTGENKEAVTDNYLDEYLQGVLSIKPIIQKFSSSNSINEHRSDQSYKQLYVINTNTGRFHYEDCDSVNEMSESNKRIEETTRENLILRGYTPCANCKP